MKQTKYSDSLWNLVSHAALCTAVMTDKHYIIIKIWHCPSHSWFNKCKEKFVILQTIRDHINKKYTCIYTSGYLIPYSVCIPIVTELGLKCPLKYLKV